LGVLSLEKAIKRSTNEVICSQNARASVCHLCQAKRSDTSSPSPSALAADAMPACSMPIIATTIAPRSRTALIAISEFI